MNEKEQIEKAIAEEFLEVYNSEFNKSFTIQMISDKPDIICADCNGEKFNLEITMTEDRSGDIKALLGRSDHKNLEYIKIHGMGPASELNGNVINNVCKRILDKMNKDYGMKVALVLRDTSGVGWDWDFVIDDIKNRVTGLKNPFDLGIWILSPKKEIYRII